MLVLGCRENRSITIFVGEQKIVLRVVRACNGNAKIGIEAPKEFRILRDSLINEREQAA